MSSIDKQPVVWLLSAYRADSHGAWTKWLQSSLPEIDWSVLELPGRFFRWRIRGNPISWLDQLPDAQPDLILATSMVDLATIRGLHPRIANVASIYYFHENQFAYPLSGQQSKSVDPQMVQLYGALATDKAVFNSSFNRDSFLDGVDTLLEKLPDAVPPGIRQRLESKCTICPVPISPISTTTERDDKLILWNHRWEYDKNPELFASAMIELANRGVNYKLALLGPRPEKPPEALTRLRRHCVVDIVADGKLPLDQYRETVAKAGIVISTTRHEFQGVALMEAVSAGACPLVPDALCYPEQYGSVYRYPAGDQAALVDRLEQWLTRGIPPRPDVSQWYGENLVQKWRRLLLVNG